MVVDDSDYKNDLREKRSGNLLENSRGEVKILLLPGISQRRSKKDRKSGGKLRGDHENKRGCSRGKGVQDLQGIICEKLLQKTKGQPRRREEKEKKYISKTI